MPPALPRNPAPRNSPNQPGRRRTPGLSGHNSPLAGSQPCRGGKGCLRNPPLGADASLQVGKNAVGEVDPGAGSRRPKSRVGILSAQWGSRPPATRAARALRQRILPGACAHRVRRAALCLPSGSSLGLQLRPAPLPRAPSPPAPGARRPRPLSPAPAAACLCCFLSLDRLPVGCSPQVRLGWGGSSPLRLNAPAAARLLAGHAPAPAGCKERRRECTSPSSSCSEPRVLGEGKPESSGKPLWWQRAVEARVQPRGPRRREITSPGGAGWMWRRPGGWCTGRASSGAAAGTARAGLSRAPGPGRRAGAPGALASHRLTHASASSRFGPRCRAPRPTGGVPGSSPPPGAAQSLFAESPARLSRPLLRSGPTDRL